MDFLDYVEKKEEGLSLEEIRKFYGMSESEFRRRPFDFGVEIDLVKQAEIKNEWTKEQEDYLKENHFLLSITQFQKILNKNEYAVKDKIKKLVAAGEMKKKNRTLTEKEEEFARNSASTKTVYEIAYILKVEPHIVGRCIKDVKRLPNKNWTEKEVIQLARMWADNVNVYVIAHKLKRNVDAVKGMVQKIGAKRRASTEHTNKVIRRIKEDWK